MALQLQTPTSRSAASQSATAAFIFVMALLAALIVRLPRLDLRPMHTDEAVQAQLHLGEMLDGKPYVYNSRDGHGPMLVFTARLFTALTGIHSFAELSERFLRLTPVVYSIGLILVLLLMRDGLGRMGMALAALLAAVGPMLVFFSRYFIMEVPLVFFTTLAIAAVWRFSISRHPGWLYLAGAAVGFMHATKETSLILVIAGSLALIGTAVLEFFTAGAGISVIDRRRHNLKPVRPVHLAGAAFVAALTSFTLYSNFFRDLAQPFDSLTAYFHYAERAGGAGHQKPWWYYFRLLIGRRESDGFIAGEIIIVLLALAGAAKAIFIPPDRNENYRLQRFFALYAAAVLIGFSIIRYKTPWSILSADFAIIILAGIGAAALISAPFRPRVALAIKMLLAVGIAHLALQVWRQNFIAPADEARNPYVYAHTSTDALRLVEVVKRALASHEAPASPSIMIIHPEFGWPLPWYFRRYQNVGATDQMADESTDLSAADVIIMPHDSAALVGALMTATHGTVNDSFELRPGVNLGLVLRKVLLPPRIDPLRPGLTSTRQIPPPPARSLPAPAPEAVPPADSPPPADATDEPVAPPSENLSPDPLKPPSAPPGEGTSPAAPASPAPPPRPNAP